jgi:ABC-type multidrug transport system fused ATPase/permease subunit
VDGERIETLDLAWFRANMAFVQQEPVLFSTTIRENIRIGRLDATDAELEEVARQVNAHTFIAHLADKYDTLVGERGAHLSGGQKQRIAIARALLRNPKILLLDEATSALDYESEKIVQEALERVKVGRTTIIIAHRLSTIRNADMIVALENGQFKEMGTHNELMEKKGLYFDLIRSQTKSEEIEEDEAIATDEKNLNSVSSER